MKLNNKQKQAYADLFEDDWALEEIRKRYQKVWEVVYDPTPNDFNYALIIDGLEYDRLTDEFVKELKKL